MLSWSWRPSEEQIELLHSFREATGSKYAFSSSNFLKFVGGHDLVNEHHVMEFLWGYAPLNYRSHPEPLDELRLEIADLIGYLASRDGWDPRACLAVCDEEEMFRRRWRDLHSTPATLWLEELRSMLEARGLPSTIPLPDPGDPFGHALAERIRPGLPPLLYPPPPPAGEPTDAIEEAAAASPALGYVSSLIEIVGAGAKLTATGNLGLAHGRALAEAMGCADLFDERFGDKVFKTKSSSEIEPVELTFRWARAAGLVRSQHGKLTVTQKGRRLGRRPTEGWWALFRAAVLKLDWPKARHRKDRMPFWGDLICKCIPAYLRCAHDAGSRGLAILPLADATWPLVQRRWVTDDLSEDQVALQKSHIRWAMNRGLFVPLELLGCAETWIGAAHETARVSPLGIWAIRRLAEEEGGAPSGPGEAPPGVVVLDDWRRRNGRR